MPPRGNESFLRRQKEVARQQKQKEKLARREERRSQKGSGHSSGELRPDELTSVAELTGLPDIVPDGDGQPGGE